MRIIDVPETIMVDRKDDKAQPYKLAYTFKSFLQDAIDSYAGFGKGFAGIRQGAKLYRIIEEHGNGDPLRFEDADYDALKLAVETCPYVPAVARQSISFVEALAAAQSVDTPTKK